MIPQTATQPVSLARRLGLFDASMIVMGGIIGSGIFMNPYVVAQRLHSPLTILLAWAFGGLIALAGAFVYAELGSRRPEAGGQYAYLREAYHPSIAFLYGWTLLLVVQTGGMAAVALTFSRYFLAVTGAQISDSVVAASAILLITIVNCLGVRAGSTMQSLLMVLKIIAIAALIFCGLLIAQPIASQSAPATMNASLGSLFAAFCAGLIPVLFAYGGWQTVNFIAGEVRDPRKNLPRGLILGVCGVIALYLAVNYVCLRVLGAPALAATVVPASKVMEAAFGQSGSRFIAAGVAISTLGFLSQGMLTAPRVYYAMAQDGLFLRSVGTLNPKTQAPVFAILLQGFLTFVITLSGRYEQILNYVVSSDFIFFGLTGTCVFLLRKKQQQQKDGFNIPGHPWTTLFFVAACWMVVAATVYNYPYNSGIGFVIIFTGLPVYYFWNRKRNNEKF